MDDPALTTKPAGRWRRTTWWLAPAAAFAVAATFLGRLPAGDDLYIHLAWAQQSMHCLAQGSLPVWLPDMNAGFGSPGIRLYSPLGPVLEGALGLAFGSAGRGLRAAAALAVIGLLLAAASGRGRTGAAEVAAIAFAPMAFHSLAVRAAWSELLAVPLMWWLLDRGLRRALRPIPDGVALGVLWLVHAPTTMMTVALLALIGLLRRDRRLALTLAKGGGVAAGLTAWHWLPLLSEASMVDTSTIFGGLFRVDRNLLGSASAHNLEGNIWLGWVAIALLGAALTGRWWRDDPVRSALIVACVALASRLALPLWLLPTPLRLLQFPWRWLLPASVLAARPLVTGPLRARAMIAVAAMLAPFTVLHWPAWVADPGLRAATTWQEAGRTLHAAIGGNPFYVDVAEHRPAAFASLAGNLERFSGAPVILGLQGDWRVIRWRPLDREVEVDAREPGTVELRLLATPFWRASVDGRARPAETSRGVIGVAVPKGRHRVRVSWIGDPLSRVGQAAAGVTLGVLLLLGAKRRSRSSKPVAAEPA